jgi:hypothetical protein
MRDRSLFDVVIRLLGADTGSTAKDALSNLLGGLLEFFFGQTVSALCSSSIALAPGIPGVFSFCSLILHLFSLVEDLLADSTFAGSPLALASLRRALAYATFAGDFFASAFRSCGFLSLTFFTRALLRALAQRHPLAKLLGNLSSNALVLFRVNPLAGRFGGHGGV